MSECSNQGISLIGWAYAVSNVDVPALFNAYFVSVCVNMENDFTHSELAQLYQWQLWREEVSSNFELPP